MRFKQKRVAHISYLRVIIVAETFGEGVVVYLQLRDLCEKRKTEPGDTEAELWQLTSWTRRERSWTTAGLEDRNTVAVLEALQGFGAPGVTRGPGSSELAGRRKKMLMTGLTSAFW